MSVRNSLYFYVATCAIAMAACQPSEGPAERAGRQADQAAERVANQAERAGDNVKEAVEDAKK